MAAEHIGAVSNATGEAGGLLEIQGLRFRQQFLSAGAELDLPVAPGLDLTLGAGVDASLTPLTGDKPDQPSQAAPGLSAILRWSLSDDLSLKASVAQRTRFATMREQFGQALGRFLPNPGLKPERARTAELSLSWRASDALHGDAAVWLSDARDSLGQHVVSVDGSRLRQRYNMRGAFTYGLEASANWRLTDRLTSEFSAAFQFGSPRSEPGNPGARLVQQVNRQIGAALDWTPLPALDLRAEYRHHGRAHDLDETGAYVRLQGATIVNLRAFATLARWHEDSAMLASVSVENITDELLLPQLGLPAPGRTIRMGLRIVFGN